MDILMPLVISLLIVEAIVVLCHMQETEIMES